MKIEIDLPDDEIVIQEMVELKPASRAWSREILIRLRNERMFRMEMQSLVAARVNAIFGDEVQIATVSEVGTLVIDRAALESEIKKMNEEIKRIEDGS